MAGFDLGFHFSLRMAWVWSYTFNSWKNCHHEIYIYTDNLEGQELPTLPAVWLFEKV